jgi:hypothetical protein
MRQGAQLIALVRVLLERVPNCGTIHPGPQCAALQVAAAVFEFARIGIRWLLSFVHCALMVFKLKDKEMRKNKDRKITQAMSCHENQYRLSTNYYTTGIITWKVRSIQCNLAQGFCWEGQPMLT